MTGQSPEPERDQVTGADVLARGARVLWRGIRDEPRLFGISVGGSIFFGMLVIGQAAVVGRVLSDVIEPSLAQGRVLVGPLALAAVALMGMSVGRVIGIFGRRLGAGFMQYDLQARYRREVTRRYLELPVSWHQRHPTGTLLSNANSDVEAAWFPIAPLPFAVGTVAMLLGAVAMLLATDWVLALVGMVVFPALAVLNIAYSRRMAPRQARAQQLRAEVSAIAHESFDGALVVKTMGQEIRETDRFAARAYDLREALIRVGRLRGLFDPLMESLPFLGTLAALLVGAVRMQQGAVDLEELLRVTFLFTVLAFPIRAIGWVLGELPRSVAGWDRVESVLRATGKMPYGGADLPGAGASALHFDGVDYSYEPGQQVLHGVTFSVPAGRTVALVGPTGSGKSTIAALAARLIDPDEGVVRVDAADVRELSAASLARGVALVPQLAFVFDDTVRANVALDRDGIDDERVGYALRAAQADGFIERLPAGFDTELGERGTSLSGGQKQRLTLARALAGRPRLLIMDDATSAVDPRVEARILASLRGTADATSTLVVAYRRATIALADEVVYVEHGRVVAHGTHDELLDTAPGYADLVTAYEKAELEREREHAYDDADEPAGPSGRDDVRVGAGEGVGA